jgi:hypothetical protein
MNDDVEAYKIALENKEKLKLAETQKTIGILTENQKYFNNQVTSAAFERAPIIVEKTYHKLKALFDIISIHGMQGPTCLVEHRGFESKAPQLDPDRKSVV